MIAKCCEFEVKYLLRTIQSMWRVLLIVVWLLHNGAWFHGYKQRITHGALGGLSPTKKISPKDHSPNPQGFLPVQEICQKSVYQVGRKNIWIIKPEQKQGLHRTSA